MSPEVQAILLSALCVMATSLSGGLLAMLIKINSTLSRMQGVLDMLQRDNTECAFERRDVNQRLNELEVRVGLAHKGQ